MKTLLLVDGNAIIHRAFFALPPFKTKEGTPTNAVYGFLTMLYRAISDFHPNYVAVCFDTPKPTFRQKLYKEYQIQRPPTANELKIQISLLKDLLKKAGIYQVEKEGYEADDIIGTIAETAKKKNIKNLILTGDRDITQVIDRNIFVVSPQIGITKTQIYDEEEVEKKFGVKPKQIPDFKALVGDPSDNYPGAPGIGPKTAASLLGELKNVESLLKNLSKIKDERIKVILKQNKDQILLAKKLAKIVTDVAIGFKLDKAKFTGFKKELKEGLLQLEMKSLAQRFFEEQKNKEPQKNKKSASSAESQTSLF